MQPTLNQARSIKKNNGVYLFVCPSTQGVSGGLDWAITIPVNAASGAGQSLSDSTTLMSWTIELCKNESGEQQNHPKVKEIITHLQERLHSINYSRSQHLIRARDVRQDVSKVDNKMPSILL